MAAITKIKQLHLVVLPFPLLGHINPMLQLALRLASVRLATKVKVTFACAQKYLEKFRKSWEESGILNQSLESSISIEPIPDDFVPGSNMVAIDDIMQGSLKLKENFEAILRERIIPVHGLSCIVSDSMLSGWTKDLAEDFGVPWICYFPLPAANLIAADSFLDLLDQGVLCVDSKGANIVAPENAQLIVIPGLPPLSRSDVPCTPLSVLSRDRILKRRQASWLLFNTVDALEFQEMQALREQLGYTNAIAVGPLQPVHLLEDMKQEFQSPNKVEQTGSIYSLSGSSIMPDHLNFCLYWLDKVKAPVLYVSFGSFVNLDMETLNKLLLALLESGVFFLWAIRKDLVLGMSNDDWDKFSSLAKSTGRGLVVKWAPQLKVLRHPAIGAFLTHCGWNSTFESICAGVPMLAWPVNGDQPLNAKYIVDVWKVGLRISPQIDMVFVIKEILTNDIYKLTAVELGHQCRAAVKQSEANLISMLESLPADDET